MAPGPIGGRHTSGLSTHLLIIIPTRNRNDFALATVESILLEVGDLPVTIVVSDNSDDRGSAEELSKRLLRLASPSDSHARVEYLRASGDLDMSDHWNWALSQAESWPSSHVLYLTDRSVVNRAGLVDLLATIETNPTTVISFGTNTIDDLLTPVALLRAGYSHEIVPVASGRLLALVAESIIPLPLPRMLNSVVPRPVIESIRLGFGSPFGSTAPDYYFCFRALAIVPEIIYYDRDVITLHGLGRSNGMSTNTGILSRDARDFLDREKIRGRWAPNRFGADITTTYRIILDEYRMAASLARGDQFTPFPPYNESAYRRAFAIETDGFAEGSLKLSNQDALRRQGVQFSATARRRRSLARVTAYIRFIGLRDSIPLLLDRVRPPTPPTFGTPRDAIRFVEETAFAPKPSQSRLSYLT